MLHHSAFDFLSLEIAQDQNTMARSLKGALLLKKGTHSHMHPDIIIQLC